MPKLNPNHIAHCGGFIKPVKPTQFRAHIRIKGRQHRAQFRDLTSAKLWIENIAGEYGEAFPPLTRQQLADAMRAQTLLPPGVSLSEAAQAYVMRVTEAHRDDGWDAVYDSPRLADASADFQQERGKNISLRTQDEYRRYLANFIDAIGADMRLANITDPMIRQFIINATPSVHNATLAYLSSFFTWAFKRGYVAVNPCIAIERAKKAKPPLGVLTPEALTELLTRARTDNPAVIPYIVVGAFAGLRPNETLRLDAERIKARYIILDAAITKTADARTVEIRPNLRAWLEAYPFAMPATTTGAINKRIRKLCQQKPVIAWPHNCLRHSFATYAYEQTKNAASVSADMGHVNTKVFFKHYRALAHPGDGERWFAILPHPVLN